MVSCRDVWFRKPDRLPCRHHSGRGAIIRPAYPLAMGFHFRPHVLVAALPDGRFQRIVHRPTGPDEGRAVNVRPVADDHPHPAAQFGESDADAGGTLDELDAPIRSTIVAVELTRRDERQTVEAVERHAASVGFQPGIIVPRHEHKAVERSSVDLLPRHILPIRTLTDGVRTGDEDEVGMPLDNGIGETGFLVRGDGVRHHQTGGGTVALVQQHHAAVLVSVAEGRANVVAAVHIAKQTALSGLRADALRIERNVQRGGDGGGGTRLARTGGADEPDVEAGTHGPQEGREHGVLDAHVPHFAGGLLDLDADRQGACDPLVNETLDRLRRHAGGSDGGGDPLVNRGLIHHADAVHVGADGGGDGGGEIVARSPLVVLLVAIIGGFAATVDPERQTPARLCDRPVAVSDREHADAATGSTATGADVSDRPLDAVDSELGTDAVGSEVDRHD